MKRFFFFVIVMMGIISCLKEKQLPDQPQLTFTSFDIDGSVATLRMKFTDGDGNFGIDQADSTGIFADCYHKDNLYMEYYELQNGIWQHIVIDACDEPDSTESDVPYYFIVPWVKPTGQDQTQEGDIKVVVQDWFQASAFDTVKFEIHIVDRSLNSSNTVEAGPFIKN